MILEYEPATQVSRGIKTSNSGGESWNQEQIGDFVRKLGFLDKDEEKGDIKHFLHLHQVNSYRNLVHDKYYIL